MTSHPTVNGDVVYWCCCILFFFFSKTQREMPCVRSICYTVHHWPPTNLICQKSQIIISTVIFFFLMWFVKNIWFFYRLKESAYFIVIYQKLLLYKHHLVGIFTVICHEDTPITILFDIVKHCITKFGNTSEITLTAKQPLHVKSNLRLFRNLPKVAWFFFYF